MAILEFVKKQLEPPNFPGDETKSAQARLMNSLGNFLVLGLIIYAAVFVPFFARHKLASWLVLLTIFVIYAVSRYFMLRGKIDLSSQIILVCGWVVCQVMVFLGGGVYSPIMFSISAITTVVGLLLSKRGGYLFLVFSSSFGLLFAMMQEYGLSLPQYFDFTPLHIWFYFTTGLLFISLTMNLTVQKLKSALDLANRQNEARQKAEAILRESEEKYRTLFDNAGDAILIHDLQGWLLAANTQAVNRLGFSNEELCSMNISQLDSPAQNSKIPERLEMIQRESSCTFETEHCCKNGLIAPVEVSARRVKWGGKPAVMSICRDIAERKAAENALRASQSETQAILNSIPDLMFEVDGEGGICDYHAPQPNALYLPPEMFLGRKIVEVLPESASSVIMGALSQASRQGWHHGATYFLDYPEGERWFDLGIQTKKSLFGQDCRYIVLARDITERKQAYQAEKEQRAIADALRDSVIALNSTLNFHEVLERILDLVGRVVAHEAANIMLLDTNRDYMEFVCSRGYAERDSDVFEARILKLADMPLLARAASKSEPLIISDVVAEPEWHDFPSRRWVRSFLTAPIRIHQETVGFINLDSGVPGFFNPSHAERIMTFADQAAVAFENARLYEAVKKLAVTDGLTGIFNRTYFEAELARIEEAHEFPVSLVVVDLDNMKVINDRQGHPVGDHLLRRTAAVLQTVLRAEDILARIGGDEFAMLLPRTNLDTAERLVASIRAAVDADNVCFPDLTLQLSLGLSTAEHANLMQAYIHADQRMYQNKAMRKSNEPMSFLSGA
jgi:diguanylate cyclase (GGDEF)-like protein/PAS domain S-box-containing protein